jgi:hypothetical protein
MPPHSIAVTIIWSNLLSLPLLIAVQGMAAEALNPEQEDKGLVKLRDSGRSHSINPDVSAMKLLYQRTIHLKTI